LGNLTVLPKTGYDFSRDLFRQAESFGASFFSGSAESLRKEGDVFIVGISDGAERGAKAVIIATGATRRLLGIPGEKEFTGKGVSYCATCDGPFFKNKKIFVVGGGDAACDEANYLSRLSDKVTMIHRRDSFRAQKAIAERVLQNPKIEVRFNTVMKEIKGGQKVKSAVLENSGSGKVYEEPADAVFVFAGGSPQSSLVSSDGGLRAGLDGNGCIITDHKMATNIPGLFAAGDVRGGVFRQVVVAAGEGAVAAHCAAEYILMK
jgi:thioredoxin reductase (NADPH)